ncbi:hypothetical protein EV702DRAFT_1179381 [Suillus placidus]|uniref:Uncharacterized protein n=1 Tax=Suillus placidus TaxID=48579 RepID=A0A9P7D3A7_9AGAM|nr:hypothetical protein EV702DRAFT_1179381 [Suillus placidus]
MPNQWKPTPPLEEITPHILHLWKAHQTDKMIIENLWKVIDTSRYGIGITKFKEICNAMGLQRTRQQNHSIESIQMVSLLFHEKDMKNHRNVVISYFAAYKAGLVHQRKARRLQQRRFWAAGVNDLFAVNQHDKWLWFGLGLHTRIEPFSGRIRIIDPGSENYGITNAHTMLHQMYDSSLHSTLQHQWMHTKKNVMPEIAWSQLCRHFTPGFESLLDEGVVSIWYDIDNVFIPWLQCELDRYQDHVNNTAKRRDRNKVLPHSVLNLIYDSPEDFWAMDFKVTIDQDGIDHVRRTYIKPDHPVFDLVPQPLNHYIQHHYDDLGQPPVTRQSAWRIYLDLLHSI